MTFKVIEDEKIKKFKSNQELCNSYINELIDDLAVLNKEAPIKAIGILVCKQNESYVDWVADGGSSIKELMGSLPILEKRLLKALEE